MQTTFGKMGLKIPPQWYEQPTAFKGNPTTLVGHDGEVHWPRYTQKLDYELELAAAIGASGPRYRAREGAGAHPRLRAAQRLLGARRTEGRDGGQHRPRQGEGLRLGPGPLDLTPDDLGDPTDLAMRVLVNDEVWASSTPGAMQWSCPEIIAHTSQDEPLNIGDMFGSGTVNSGCGLEIDRWVAPGDVVELQADRIGVLRHRIARRAGPPSAAGELAPPDAASRQQRSVSAK